MRYFQTLNSAYEVDTDGQRVRRLQGMNAPTPRQGQDGTWKSYETISEIVVGQSVVIVWRVFDNVLQTTITSLVQIIC